MTDRWVTRKNMPININGTLAVLEDTQMANSSQYQQPIRYILKSIWQRLQEVTIPLAKLQDKI